MKIIHHLYTAKISDLILSCLAEAFATYRSSYLVETFLDTVLTAQTLKQRMKPMTYSWL